MPDRKRSIASGRRRPNWSAGPERVVRRRQVVPVLAVAGRQIASRRRASSRARRAACSAGSERDGPQSGPRDHGVHVAQLRRAALCRAGSRRAGSRRARLARDNAAFVVRRLALRVPDGRDVVQDRHERAPALRRRHVAASGSSSSCARAKLSDRAGGIAEVGAKRGALGRADLQIGGRQLARQRRIVAGVLAQALEVDERGLHDRLARIGRARQALDPIVDVEHERVGQRSNLLESTFGAAAPRTAPRQARQPG